MVKAAEAGSAKAKGRQGTKTDLAVVTANEFERMIRDLDGEAEHKKILLYGDSGCGKTVIAGSCPKSLILACEPGYISAANTDLGLDVGPRKIVQINNSATLLGGLDWLEGGAFKNYDWVILEGATTLETKVRLGYTAEAFDNNPASRTHRNLPDKPDYFNTQNFIRSAMARLVDLPVNVLITAHAMRYDDDTGDRLVAPSFQQKDGALSNYVAGLMHCVGFMRKRTVTDKETKKKREVRRVLWQQSVDPETGTIYFAKDQFAALPRFMDDTNMFEILEYIEGVDEEEE